MRNDMQEPGLGKLTGVARPTAINARALDASAVDAALDDESGAGIVAERGSRREFPARADGAEASRVSIDDSHVADKHDRTLIRQLSRQLALLEAQQMQIRQLLELTERRFAAPNATQSVTRIDR